MFRATKISNPPTEVFYQAFIGRIMTPACPYWGNAAASPPPTGIGDPALSHSLTPYCGRGEGGDNNNSSVLYIEEMTIRVNRGDEFAVICYLMSGLPVSDYKY